MKPARRNHKIRNLFLGGAVVVLGFPSGPTAFGITGTAIQAAYTPRESVGASPTVNLLGANLVAAASVSSEGTNSETASQASSGTTQTHHVSSDNEGNGTVASRRRRRKAQGREDSKPSNSGVARGDTSKDFQEAKQAKDTIIAPAPKPLITLSTGFESRYIYHGVDIVGFNSTLPNNNVPKGTSPNDLLEVKSFNDILRNQPKANVTSPITYANASFAFEGFHFTAGYISAIDPTIPSREEIGNQAITFNRYYDSLHLLGLATAPGTSVHVFTYPKGTYNNSTALYQEVDLNLDYTVGIISHVLDATVGYNSFIIPNHEFKGTNYQGEALFRLTYKQIPYIQPNITYYRYISDARYGAFVQDKRDGTFNNSGFIFRRGGEYLNGNYVEARIDGAVPIFKNGNFEASFTPYALVSVNDGYLTKEVGGTFTEFNTLETGFKLPVAINSRFVVTPYLNYGYDISRSHEANDFRGSISPFKEDIWGGVTFSYRF